MGIRAWAICLILICVPIAAVQQLPVFEFKDARAVGEWKGSGDVAELKASGEGLEIVAKGPIHSSWGRRDFPENQLLSLRVRIKSEEGGELQIFYYTRGQRAGLGEGGRDAGGLAGRACVAAGAGEGISAADRSAGHRGKTILCGWRLRRGR